MRISWLAGKIAGAVRDVGDSRGDSRLFGEGLARVCREKFGATLLDGLTPRPGVVG